MEAAARALFEREFGNCDHEKWSSLLAEYRVQAQAAVQAYLTAMEKVGFVMVPVEPTPAMVEAGYSALMLGDDCFGAQSITSCHRAMLAARPTIG